MSTKMMSSLIWNGLGTMNAMGALFAVWVKVKVLGPESVHLGQGQCVWIKVRCLGGSVCLGQGHCVWFNVEVLGRVFRYSEYSDMVSQFG